jgi:Ni/Fe-hydrogenase subunit HybB-like protein
LGFYLSIKLGELLVTEEINLLFTSGKYSLLFWAEMIIGVIIPIVMFSIKKVRFKRTATLVGALLVTAGIVMNRFNASWFAILPLDNIHYSPSWMEIAILAGVFSGVLLVYTLIANYFPVFAETVCDDDRVSKDGHKVKLEQIKATLGD